VETCGKLGRRTVTFAAPERSSGSSRPAGGAYRPLVAMRACSACAGDYEDPDRAAGDPDEEIEEGPARGQEDLPGGG
jgi:hypothetical protein